MKVETKLMKVVTIKVDPKIRPMLEVFEWDCGDVIPYTAITTYEREDWSFFVEFIQCYLTDGFSLNSDCKFFDLEQVFVIGEFQEIMKVEFDETTAKIVIE